MTEAVIVATARTPIGRAFKGSLREMRPDDLSVQVVRGLLDQVPALDPETIEDLYWGCAEPSFKHGSNMARVIAVLAGLDHLPAATVNRFCASSTQTMRMAFHAIKAGEGDAFLVGGVECVSQYEAFTGAGGSTGDAQNPLFAEAAARSGESARTNAPWHDPREDGLLPDVYLAMGQTAENVASLRGISRERQDEWGVTSQNRAEKAIADGFFEREILPVTLPDGSVVSRDDGPRAGVTLEGVQGLQPVFREDGTVTAGNCCPLNDGASGVVVMSDARAQQLGLTPLARIVSTGVSALSPEVMGLGPVEASRQALARAGMAIERHGPLRDQRGVRGPGAPQRRRPRDGPRQAQRARRSHRPRAPVRVHRHPDHDDTAQRAGVARRAVRARDDVRGRRAGHGDHRRAPLLTPRLPGLAPTLVRGGRGAAR